MQNNPARSWVDGVLGTHHFRHWLTIMSWAFLLAYIAFLWPIVASYDIVNDFSGQNFFDGWDFYGNYDNLTEGDVWWLNQTDAFSQGLAQVNSAGRAVIKVDNTTNVAYDAKRNTVRITTQAFYDVGSLWIIDAVHVPFGCSVWPAIWTKGPLWPNDGEIDIVEAVNVMSNNQMALHTTPGCYAPLYTDQTGSPVAGEQDCSTAAGCVVAETKPNSYESGFAAAGGGVWATQFDVTGIYIWFWSRADVPPSIAFATSTSSITDLTEWGVPSASYPVSSCNISEFFTAQQLVIDITLCGDWAGIPPVYNPTCINSGPTGTCYGDNVVGPGSPKYDDAYFELNYVRAYTTGGAPSATPGAYSAPTDSSSTSSTPSSSSSSDPLAGSAVQMNICATVWVLPAVGLVLGALMLL